MLHHILGNISRRACVQESRAAQWRSADVELAFRQHYLQTESWPQISKAQKGQNSSQILQKLDECKTSHIRSADVGLKSLSVYKSIIGTGKTETGPRSVLPLCHSLGVTLGMFGSASLLLWALRLSADSGLSGTELLLPSVFLGFM